MVAATQGSNAGTIVSTGAHASVVTAAETNQLKSGKGKVGHVTVWGDDAGTTVVCTLYDAISGTTLPFWRWITADGKGVFAVQTPFDLGLRVITSGTMPTNGGITVVWA